MLIYKVTSAIVLISVLQFSLGAPGMQQKMPFDAPMPGCPAYQVGQSHYSQQVSLENELTFIVKPNHPVLVMDIVPYEQELYQAVIEGASIKIHKCYSDHSQCSVWKEGTAKTTSLLEPRKWNNVTVSYVNDEISVSVDKKLKVKGGVDGSTWDIQQQDMQVIILGASDVDMSSSNPLPTNYSVDVNVLCNETYTPVMAPVTPVADQPETPTLPAPYPQCPLYEVRHGRPDQYISLQDKIVMAIVPSKPMMCLHFHLQADLYKATIDGTMMDLYHCKSDNTGCQMLSSGGTKDSEVLIAKAWNNITISLLRDMVSVSVNMKFNVTGKTMSVRPGVEQVEVVVVATDGVTPSEVPSDYTVSVNIACNDTFRPIPVARDPLVPSIDNQPIVGNGTSSENHGNSGRNIVLWVLLGLFLFILCAVIIALMVNSYMKKRSANINQHTPLQEQQQR